MDAQVDAYIERSDTWPEEMTVLRPILLGCGLDEAIKWGKPCYSADGANIAIMQEMKGFLALMFFKGALLEDPTGILHEQGPNSRSARRMEFTSAEQIAELADAIKVSVEDAIDVEKAGLDVGPVPEPTWCEELRARLGGDAELQAAFEGLTPGRQREYNLYFSDAKRSETRVGRIDRYVPKILAGKGFRD